MINIDALNDDEKLAALESIHKSIAESKEIQKKKITTNVELIVKALKKIESDLKQRYDETGQLIANLKNGEDGRDGKDGKDGKNGRDGRDGPVGPRGYDGLPGRNGIDGTDGVSVTDAHIDFDGSLIISLSSGRVINVGEVVAADIAEKIKVITNGGGTSQGVLDAIASLQAQIDSIASGLEYQGTWNASTNVPTLTSSVGTAGYYYIVATAGSTNLNGVTDWQIGDWAVFNGSVWQKIDQTNLVTSVAGRTGAVVLSNTDISGLGTMSTQAANNVSITGGSITGITDLAIADGGTGASTAAAAITALTGTQTSGYYLRSNGTSASLSAISAGDVPTLNQNTTGTAAGLSATLATSSGGTGLTSFTANGVVYASSTSALATGTGLRFDGTNLSVGTSALSAGKFSTLADLTAVNGLVIRDSATTYANNDNFVLLQNSAGSTAGSLTHPASQSLGVWGFDDIRFLQGAGSTEGMRLTSTGLGIGTSSPSYKLDVFSGTNNSDVAKFTGAQSAKGLIVSTYASNGNDGGAKLSSTDSLAFSTASTERMRITSAGLVGIGTSSPAYKLDVATGAIQVKTGAAVSSAIYDWLIGYSGTEGYGVKISTIQGSTSTRHGMAFYTSAAALPAERMRIDENGNVGIGTSSPANKLDVRTGTTGNIATFFGTSTYHLAIEEVGSVMFLDANNGSATIGFKTNDTERMRISSAGFVGIGTSAPAFPLDVQSTGTGSTIASRIYRSDGTIALLRIGNSSSGSASSAPAFGSDTTAAVFYTSNAEKMRIDSSGNVGIGTSSPAYKLDVVAASNSANTIAVRNTDTSTANYSTQAYFRIDVAGNHIGGLKSTAKSLGGLSTQALYLTTAGAYPIAFGLNDSATPSMVLDTSGNLGVGTSSPARKLDVYGSGQFKDASGIQNVIWSEFSTGVAGIGTNNNYPIAFVSNGSERARIDSSGRFMLGTTTTSITNSEAKYFDAADGMRLFSARASTASREHIIFQNPNGTVGSISTSGSATTYSTSSDYRLKNTIAPMTGALSKVALLKPVTYKWNADGSDGEGFIAHELAEVVPQCVTGEKDAVDENGTPKYQGIDTSFLVATLTAALQEAVAKINSLEARLDAANL